MKKILIPSLMASAIASVMLSGCMTPPPAPTVDGTKRETVNAPESVESLAMRSQLAEAKQRLRLLETEVKDLKQSYEASVVAYQEAKEASGTQAVKPVNQKAKTVYVSPTPQKLFVVNYPFNRTEFRPNRELHNNLIPSALESDKVEIRGFTDSPKHDPANQKVAMLRANGAKAFLVSKGVPSEKITISFQSHGSFIADSTTVEGRAQNRRVEIEVMD
ncbi:OmpA family protein [Iodobacter fluviatilis]|uniref:OmpA-like domain-containing protein n=1 Tax=Iodobacter fluviatilis TaxID=537 RepID=A0A7G3GE23_9NEIS|nr:OmpA family protein [Iodobacter fluviatilis]QBC45850.1 hypothetical protein C1H71_20115 [Iodobacter fluviatilis]